MTCIIACFWENSIFISNNGGFSRKILRKNTKNEEEKLREKDAKDKELAIIVDF